MPETTANEPTDALPAMPRSALLLAGGDETIVAVATAEGRGALATLRVSGAKARAVASALGVGELVTRVAKRVSVKHPVDGVQLDDAIATFFPAPQSYTGEDVLELSTHGGRVVPASVFAACVAAGARPAFAGEFSRRAVINGRMDLLQAEAVADLIDARTGAMQHQALAQLDGGLSRRFAALRDDVLQLEALLAYDIDFPDEDDGPIAPARIVEAATALIAALDALLQTAPRAALLRDGALVVIAGPPNAGKSSLFNALLGESRALVTPIAGTTRDAIEALLDRKPMPLRLVDTAGLRETTELIERLGIEVSERYLASAQLVLACGDSDAAVHATIAAVRGKTNALVVPVRTKQDLENGELPQALSAGQTSTDPSEHKEAECAPEVAASTVHVSAETGHGLAALLARLDDLMRNDSTHRTGIQSERVMVTRERHRAGVAEARDEIAQFLDVWQSGALPATVAAVHLQSARDALRMVTGTINTDDVLDRVFRDFCIGK